MAPAQDSPVRSCIAPKQLASRPTQHHKKRAQRHHQSPNQPPTKLPRCIYLTVLPAPVHRPRCQRLMRRVDPEAGHGRWRSCGCRAPTCAAESRAAAGALAAASAVAEGCAVVRSGSTSACHGRARAVQLMLTIHPSIPSREKTKHPFVRLGSNKFGARS
jgi:hypothetical protein